MPTLDAYPFPTLGHILVETSWGDVPGAESVQVLRVHADGTTHPLRGYVWPDVAAGEYQHLSGGWAAFWDTEAPLDQAFTYSATAVDATGAVIASPTDDLLALDMFTRTTSPGWSSTDNGQPWTQTGGGAAADYFTDGTRGVYRFTAVGSAANRANSLSGLSYTSAEFLVYLKSNVAQTGAGNGNWSIQLRRDGVAGNYYEYRLFLVGGANITANIGRVNLGVSTNLTGFLSVPGVATNDQAVWLRGRLDGYRLRLRAWADATTEPDTWLLDITDTASSIPAPGNFSVNYSIPSSVTTTPPFDMYVDNLVLRSLDAVDNPLTVTAGPYTLASNGNFWLRDPLRPCNDRLVQLCFDPAVPCVPGAGIFFADMQVENYAPNSARFLPTNARLPVALARERRDADSTLVVVTRTFDDRDNVLATAQPGSPLQWAAPPAYGIPDRYMDVGAVSVSRGIPDMTFQPRLIQLPFTTVDRPVGPAQGVCGSRFMDLCDTYATWTLAAASGLAYSTLVTGTPATLGFRTWTTVAATWASWAAVLAAEPTWSQVLVP